MALRRWIDRFFYRSEVPRSSYDGICDAVLLDTAVKGSNSGGTGASFDWSVAKHCQEQWGIPVPWGDLAATRNGKPEVIVAGGLTDANVADTWTLRCNDEDEI